MGMFDKPKYLTGTDGLVEEGDSFTLLAARRDGIVRTPSGEAEQVKLMVKLTNGEEHVCWTSGAGIVNQIRRMESGDLPAEVRLDTVQAARGKAFVLTPANEPPRDSRTAEEIGF
jgi:hypothetical protein